MEEVNLKAMDEKALAQEIFATKKELVSLRLNLSTGQVKDSSQFSKLRKKIARAATYLRQKDGTDVE